MDREQLFDQALRRVGDREYKHNSPSGRECELWIDSVYSECLMAGAWSFASRQTDLIPDKRTGYYKLPCDCIRLLKADTPRYQLIGREIILPKECFSKPDAITITYISNHAVTCEQLPEHAPLFCRAVMLALAAKLTPKLTGNHQLAIQIEQEAYEALQRALHHDAVQSHSNDQHPLVDLLNQNIL